MAASLDSSDSNVISSNATGGVCIFDTDSNPTESNVVEGNYIGTDIGGDNPLPNTFGVACTDGSTQNRIGAAASGGAEYGNVISANKKYGVFLGVYGGQSQQALGPSSYTTVQGNYIGTDDMGDVPTKVDLANEDGVYIDGGSSDNTIGARPVGRAGRRNRQ